MTTVSHGMDVARVREIATQVQGLAGRVDDVRTKGTAQIGTLEGAWSGPDVEALTDEWEAMTPTISGAAQRLRQSASDMRRDADEQERASQGDSGWGPTDIKPLPVGPGTASIIDRITDAITAIATMVADGIRAVVDTIRDIMRNPAVAIPLLIKSIIGELKKYWDEFADFFEKFPEKFPKLAGFFSKAAPVLKFLARFAKALPVVGVVAWIADVWGVGEDLWNGELNLRDVWSKVVLGGVAAIAAFFPGVGTIVSIVAVLEQLRFDFEGLLWSPLDQAFGNNPVYQHIKNVINMLQVPFWSPGVADLLPADPIHFTPVPELLEDTPIIYGRPAGVGAPLWWPVRDRFGLH